MGQSELTIKPGRIVKIRSRLWRVDDYQDEIITVSSIDGTQTSQRRFFKPVENIEDGKLPSPKSSLVGNKRQQELLTNAYRLSMIHGAAPLLSLQRSRAVPESFQMVPVVMALNMPRVRMLIADDVGLGKTIEAGLIVTELLARHKASRLLVICPAALRKQWQEALSYFFHIDTDIISTRHRRKLESSLPPGASPWGHYPYLITSMDYAKRPEIRAQILEESWDIVVVDEAHNLAKPHQMSASQKVNKERWSLLGKIALIKEKSNHLLLLTATPHNGYSDTFASLLKVLDVGAVTGSDHKPTIRREIAKKHVCQRRRKDIEDSFTRGKNPFPKREAKEVYITPSELERQLYTSIDELGNHILTVTAFQEVLAKWTITHLHKRALSSPRALRCSLRNRLKKLEGDASDKGVTRDEARAEVLDNDTGERLDDEEAGERLDRLVWGDDRAQKTEIELIHELIAKAKTLTPRRDQKLSKLLDLTLPGLLERDSKVIIFTRYRDTLKYLEKEIPRHPKHKGISVYSVDGTLNTSERREKLAKFAEAKKAIMIATDCISEGMNLQHYTAQLIHYELPWNPNRLEQRNGRVDRYGQKRMDEVAIRTMVVDDTMEASILRVLVEKSNQIRVDHGFSPPFFGDDRSVLDLIQDKGLDIRIGQTKLDVFTDGMRKEKSNIMPFSDESIQNVLSDCFYGQTDIEMDDVQARMRKTHELVGSRKELEQFVRLGLETLGSKIEQLNDEVYSITIKDKRLGRGLKKIEEFKVTFDPALGLEKPELDVIDLAHPLVRNIIELIKEQSFVSGEHYGRTACVRTNAVERVTFVYNFLVRYSVGTTPASVIEELVTVGISGDNPLNAASLDELKNSSALADRRTSEEHKKHLEQALSYPGLDELIDSKIEGRESELITERQADRKLLEDQGIEDAVAGIDDVSFASRDLLTVTVYYPAPGGRDA